MSVSVCMATFNGEAFLEEQLESILVQLGPEDEIVVVDDGSTDATRAILRRHRDPRMRVHLNSQNRGIVAAFEKAISLASRDVIFLSDQDDRWIAGRVALMVRTLQMSKALVAASNSAFMDSAGTPLELRLDRLREQDSKESLRNILRMFSGKAAYYGCAMAFRRALLTVILPIPRFVESHDLWIALAGNIAGANAHVEADTLVRRVHGKNASLVRRSLYLKVRARVILMISVPVIFVRCWRFLRVW